MYILFELSSVHFTFISMSAGSLGSKFWFIYVSCVSGVSRYKFFGTKLSFSAKKCACEATRDATDSCRRSQPSPSYSSQNSGLNGHHEHAVAFRRSRDTKIRSSRNKSVHRSVACSGSLVMHVAGVPEAWGSMSSVLVCVR